MVITTVGGFFIVTSMICILPISAILNFGVVNHRLYRIGYVPIRYHVKIKADANANAYLPEYDKYFSNRKEKREKLAKECRQITTFIVNNNKRL